MESFTIYLQISYDKTSEGLGYVVGVGKSQLTKPTTKPKQYLEKEKEKEKEIDINIMYKYIIFFGVMSRNIIREAKTLRGRGTGTWGIGTRNWEKGLGTGGEAYGDGTCFLKDQFDTLN